jgi:hypothetical protein
MIKTAGARRGTERAGSAWRLAGRGARPGLLAAALVLAGCAPASIGNLVDDPEALVEPVVVARAEAEAEAKAKAEPCPSLAAVPDRSGVRDLAKRDLAGYRDQARADALFVSAECARNGRCGARYKFYRMLYNRAATTFDVMIKNMVAKTEIEAKFDDTLYTRYTIKDAAVQFYLLEKTSNIIRAHAKCESPASARAPAVADPGFIDRTQQQITDIFVRLAATYRTGDPAQRRQMLDRLAASSWTRFEELQRVTAVSGDTR